MRMSAGAPQIVQMEGGMVVGVMVLGTMGLRAIVEIAMGIKYLKRQGNGCVTFRTATCYQGSKVEVRTIFLLSWSG